MYGITSSSLLPPVTVLLTELLPRAPQARRQQRSLDPMCLRDSRPGARTFLNAGASACLIHSMLPRVQPGQAAKGGQQRGRRAKDTEYRIGGSRCGSREGDATVRSAAVTWRVALNRHHRTLPVTHFTSSRPPVTSGIARPKPALSARVLDGHTPPPKRRHRHQTIKRRQKPSLIHRCAANTRKQLGELPSPPPADGRRGYQTAAASSSAAVHSGLHRP